MSRANNINGAIDICGAVYEEKSQYKYNHSIKFLISITLSISQIFTITGSTNMFLSWRELVDWARLEMLKLSSTGIDE